MHPTTAGLVVASAALAAAAPLSNATASYDFIVVGGGTSGLVVANRLSEDPSVSVAVIEAGASVFDNENVTDVAGYSKAFDTPIDWAYSSTPQLYAGNETKVLRAGKALGGTSTINGMTYMRAERSQIDAWAAIGNNVTWNSLLPYYKKSEHFQSPNEGQVQDGAQFNTAAHGFVGPLAVGWPTEMVGQGFPEILNSTFQSQGLNWNGEPNAGHMRGYNIFPKTVNTTANVRADAARSFYYPFSSRSNLHIYLNSFVERLTWQDTTNSSLPFANGVVLRDPTGKVQRLSASKEVILSAGSLRSPLILEQSGVGSPTVLEKHGIEVQVNNPNVGENLQDQTTVDTQYTATRNFTGSGGFIGYYNARDVFGNDTDRISAEVKASLAAYAHQVSTASRGTVALSTLEKLFNIQHKLIFEDLAVISEVIVVAPAAGSSTIEYWGLLPFSRGNIHISSSNASTPALINPNFFQFGWDIKQLIGTARAARAVANTSPFSKLITDEVLPGHQTVPRGASDQVWGEWLKSTFRSNFHYISTAAMMPREMGGVVDSDHLVYGTANVRVVDASVMPFQVSGHLTSTLYALAERASDRIKARYE
ncbi:hypothetical protein CKM354_000064300 [Cercospora kikuchii]|uniref:Glucose-methanol-choline oxidoreductase N-terminal domain-containing protein n=1 Tax=Cercospora kikuchii TaxID=84275 RepID=A0A9P3F7F9_9PEZI|nr:uncharacterized protein CKM354_000064300 [Cercospora kikuchii]GIZ37186.1 hypothetical protein CKM354_000064300 [Cercospora kikuchii]